MRHSRISIFLLLVSYLLTGLTGQAASRPNIILIMLDDFGNGQFAPISRHLTVEDISQEHLDFVNSLGENSYTAAEALALSQKAMPTMNSLADEGVVFTQAYSTSNLCAPARTGLATAKRQIRWGAYRNMDINILGLPDGSVLAERLQDSGYATGFIGKWHMGTKDHALKEAVLAEHGLEPSMPYPKLRGEHPEVYREVVQTGVIGSVVDRDHPLNHGFDYYFGYNSWTCPFYDSEMLWENHTYTGLQTKYNTDLFTDKALAFMERVHRAGEGNPFFVKIAYHATHAPLDPLAPEEYSTPFNSEHEYLDVFYSHVYAVDQNIKRMLQWLEENGHKENTLLIFCADNGATCTPRSVLPGNAPSGGYKGTLKQGAFQVPLLLWYPRGFSQRGVMDAYVSTMDIMPTALIFAGVELPLDLDGKSLQPLLQGQTQESPHDLFIWAGIHSRAWGFGRYGTPGNPDGWRDGSPGGWVIKDKSGHLLRRISSMPAGLHPDLPDGHPARFELIDTRTDPHELINLYQEEPEIADQLKRQYEAFSEKLPEPAYKGWREDSWRVILRN